MAEQYIEIVDRSNGTIDKKRALKVSRRLAVAYSHSKYDTGHLRIFSIIAQKPLLDVRFTITKEDDYLRVVEAAKLIEAAYYDPKEKINYLDILDADKDIDVLANARFSVANGHKIYTNLMALERQDIVTLDDIKKAINDNSK